MKKLHFNIHGMKGVKVCFILLFFTTYSLSLSAQGQTNKDSILVSKIGQITINAGIGASMIYILEQGFFGGSGAVTTSMSPVASLIADYRFSRRSSIGLAIAYQSTIGEPGDGEGDPLTFGNPMEYMSRTNMALRYLFHFCKRPNVDIYWGIRLGASYWTDVIDGETGVLAIGNNSWRPSFQTLWGFQTYFSGFIGTHLELALGTPYFVEGGVTFRIKTKVRANVNSAVPNENRRVYWGGDDNE